ncbi:hypothetical protein FHS01_000274 [Longimicrobium terrae]|uniref:Uncharacterized protein n=1 Tax=Longimicrobium terrae TaxID=1639882 RepID=A0A841GNE7_9BACT|nr:hypothetical protein [Longimicrobium terrae]MBB6068842.1 hypothetical protein [Longimicrobium terrae]
MPYEGPAPEGLDLSPFIGCHEARFYKRVDGRPDNRWSLQLDSAVSRSTRPGSRHGPGVRHATTSNQRHDVAQWWGIPGGVQIHVGDSLHGYYVEFFPRADSLVGRAYYYSDTRGGFGTERVSAHRTSCSP